jgi:rubrerythrin
MIKVFEDFDIALVGQYQSVLEASGIATFKKNRFGTSGSGELPFVEVVPQLWVLNDADESRARALISELAEPGEQPQREDWVCPACGTALEAAFTQCWNCSGAIDSDP